MSILTRIGDDARQQIEQAIRNAGISVVEALLVDAIRHLLPESKAKPEHTGLTQKNTTTMEHGK